ncbi:hypothetical protein G7Y89_g4954 [Cudoniella acicularis]|uniref:Integral membrane protein n=1 Tax=Cudoniella acicularis TaxID=354080 RepID=A0A8H4W6Y0_9HELO|nr:hypothetical protein G7Y89_g4954 [Cudoniella acicularis]
MRMVIAFDGWRYGGLSLMKHWVGKGVYQQKTVAAEKRVAGGRFIMIFEWYKSSGRDVGHCRYFGKLTDGSSRTWIDEFETRFPSINNWNRNLNLSTPATHGFDSTIVGFNRLPLSQDFLESRRSDVAFCSTTNPQSFTMSTSASRDTLAEAESRAGTGDETSPGTPTLQLNESDIEASPAKATLVPTTTAADCATFVKHKRHFLLTKECRLKNSLLAGVGFLELANAGDFAANVWNDVPVPTFVAVLMGLGGTFALAMFVYAAVDAVLSYRNVRLLRRERHFLQSEKRNATDGLTQDLDAHLNVNFRELGTEWVDRVGMDITMGFGCIMVGVGTLMAIGGANPYVYKASNLLSGYIGNTPVALYGIGNAAWSVYVSRRANRHMRAGRAELEGNEIFPLLRRRVNRVRTHASLLGMTGLIAGGASLVTATLWYGYPVLIPCIIMSVFCNQMWRRRIGYDRPLLQERPQFTKTFIIDQIKITTSFRQIIKSSPHDFFEKLIPEPESLSSILNFLVDNDLFEDFCIRLLDNTSLSTTLLGPLVGEISIDVSTLLSADKGYFPRLAEIAEVTIKEMGDRRFRYRERYLLEALGCFLCCEEKGSGEK